MKTPNNKPSTDPKLSKRPKPEGTLSFATWVLLIISFSLLAYAIYSIQTRIIDTPTKTKTPKSSVTQEQ